MVDQSREGGYRARSKALDANRNALLGLGIRFSAYSLNLSGFCSNFLKPVSIMSGFFSIFAVGWVIALYVWLGGFGEYWF